MGEVGGRKRNRRGEKGKGRDLVSCSQVEESSKNRVMFQEVWVEEKEGASGKNRSTAPGARLLKQRCVSLKSGNTVFDSDVLTDMVPTALKQRHREAVGRKGEVREGKGGAAKQGKTISKRSIKKKITRMCQRAKVSFVAWGRDTEAKSTYQEEKEERSKRRE
jgi:hypothetical protein